MTVSTWILQRYLCSSGPLKGTWDLARKLAVRLLNDPACEFEIHGKRLRMPLSHKLPIYLNDCPLYDRLPRRLGAYARRKCGPLKCIDVGANIGDTIAALRQSESDAFLAIEPNPHFRRYLESNWGSDGNVTILPLICSRDDGTGPVEIREVNGTASIVSREGSCEIERKPLDRIVAEHPLFARPDIVKVDTDGHDFEVISGARNVLSESKPILLFECASFSNGNYLRECLQVLALLNECGYGHFILYDNVGNMFGCYSLSDLGPFKNLLFYQMTSDFCYFDILVMRDEDLFEFYKLEVDFITTQMKDRALTGSALAASEL